MFLKKLKTIPLDSARSLVPSAFADRPAAKVSQEYNFIRTADVLERMADTWEIIEARQQNARDDERKDEVKHTITLRPKGLDIQKVELGGLVPITRLTNSNDWSSTFILDFAAWRAACGNGLFVAGPQYQKFNLRHDSLMGDLELVLAQFEAFVTKFFATAEKWSQIGIAPAQALQLAKQAAELRFAERATEDHARALLVVQRQADSEPTLWNVFNTIQENGTKGGTKFGAMKKSARTLTNIRAERLFNEGLFEIAAEMAG